MENAFGRVISVFLLVVAAFIVPIIIDFKKVDFLREMTIMSDTIHLVDSVCNTGALTDSQLRIYMDKLGRLGAIYDVAMEHRVVKEHQGEMVNVDSYNEQIMESIGENGRYDFGMGDYFKVVVYEMQQQGKNVVAYYGGTIKNEGT